MRESDNNSQGDNPEVQPNPRVQIPKKGRPQTRWKTYIQIFTHASLMISIGYCLWQIVDLKEQNNFLKAQPLVSQKVFKMWEIQQIQQQLEMDKMNLEYQKLLKEYKDFKEKTRTELAAYDKIKSIEHLLNLTRTEVSANTGKITTNKDLLNKTRTELSTANDKIKTNEGLLNLTRGELNATDWQTKTNKNLLNTTRGELSVTWAKTVTNLNQININKNGLTGINAAHGQTVNSLKVTDNRSKANLNLINTNRQHHDTVTNQQRTDFNNHVNLYNRHTHMQCPAGFHTCRRGISPDHPICNSEGIAFIHAGYPFFCDTQSDCCGDGLCQTRINGQCVVAPVKISGPRY